MSISSLEEKFVHELGDVYDAEHRFLEAQQKLVKQASDDSLRSMIQKHIEQTTDQIKNLEQVYELLEQKPKRVKSDAAAGLVSEGEKVLKQAKTDPLRDCLIAGAQAKVEHYEIASYRGLVIGAEQLGQADVLKLLRQNLAQEEKTADKVEQSLPKLLKQAIKAEQS